MAKQTRGQRVFNVFNTIHMLVLIFIFLVPVWHVLMGSLSDPLKLSATSGLILWPLGESTLGGYKLVMQNQNITRSYLNTFIYVGAATALGTVLSILAAYVTSRKDLRYKSPIVFLIAFTMIFNGGMIPTYMVVRNLKMLDTRWALIIPGAVSAYNIIIMRTSFAAIPDGLCEAALIDGAGHFRILVSVVLPVSKAIIAVIALFYGIQHWNAWFNAAIYLKSRSLYPLQLQLREIVLLSTEQSIIADADGIRARALPSAVRVYREAALEILDSKNSCQPLRDMLE